MPAMGSDTGPTNQTKCSVWRDCVAREVPDFYPSSPPHAVLPSEDFDERIVWNCLCIVKKANKCTMTDICFTALSFHI